MINFVVVDDNSIQRKKICNVIMSAMMNNKMDFKIMDFADYNDELIKFINEKKENTIYILDLELPSGDGIDIARLIRNENINWISPIIIITVHTSLYYEVYKQRLQILDFIGKCEDVSKNLKENIDICLKMLNKEKVYKFTYKNVEYAINLNDINYIQRDGRQTKIVTKNDILFQNISIIQIKDQLPNYFILSSKGILLNMKNVKSIDWKNMLVYFNNGTKDYLISKSHKKEIDNYEYN